MAAEIDGYGNVTIIPRVNPPKIDVPDFLLPLVGEIPAGRLVVIFNAVRLADYQGLVNQWWKELKQHFWSSRFEETQGFHISVFPVIHGDLEAARDKAIRDGVVHFLFCNQSANLQLENMADYTFYLRPGYMGILVEAGKCRRADPLKRSHASIYPHGRPD